VSTRGQISSTGFVNEYQWGNLKADPRTWMERYFDAHLYLTNWGTHRIALRLPLPALDPATAPRYCSGNQIRCWTTRTHLIFDLYSNDEEGTEDWVDPHGRLAAITAIRAELAQGDLRPLYLMWLLAVQDRELDEDEAEPSVPPGLDSLSGAQQALADFLRLDPDLLAAAATASEPLIVKTPSTATLRRWVKGLPEADKDALLLRVLQGEGPLLRSEMLRRLHSESGSRPAQGSRTVGELLAGGETAWAERQEAARRREGEKTSPPREGSRSRPGATAGPAGARSGVGLGTGGHVDRDKAADRIRHRHRAPRRPPCAGHPERRPCRFHRTNDRAARVEHAQDEPDRPVRPRTAPRRDKL
jgi:hypothetical protein